MKKILISLLLALVFCACSKDDDPKMFTTFIDVTFDGTSAYPSLVYLYDYDVAKDFDKSYDAMCKFGEYRKLYDMNGNEINYAYSSPDMLGVNIFENVAKGKYIAVALYKPEGFSWPMFYYYGYTEINVDHNLQQFTFKFVSSSKRGEFIKF